MVAASRDDRTNLVHVNGMGIDLLRAAGIYGANAAGKSNVLEALDFMSQAVEWSHRHWPPDGPIPREPFLLDASFNEEPSFFEVDFLVEGVHYQYGFVIDKEKVHKEWLYAYPKNRRQVWLAREAAGFSFGRELKGNNRAIEAFTRKNSLFLSVAAENNHQALLPVYAWFARKLRIASAHERAGRVSLKKLEREREGIVNLLKLADLGIVDFEIQWTVPDGYESSRLALATQSELNLVHAAKHGLISFPISKESRGTQAWLSLLLPILEPLRMGGVLCIDELDASLHPHLAAEVVNIFLDPVRNAENAQLIFNTHDTTLLGDLLGDAPLLRRDQVWFVEKDDEGASHLYPLTDFKPLKSEELERGYLQGRYGAIPFISPQAPSDNVQEE